MIPNRTCALLLGACKIEQRLPSVCFQHVFLVYVGPWLNGLEHAARHPNVLQQRKFLLMVWRHPDPKGYDPLGEMSWVKFGN